MTQDPCNDPCAPPPVPTCQLNLDTACVFYHICGQSTSKLPVLGIPNGTNLEIILETIDTFLGASVAYNYNSYNLSYLRSKYVVTNNQQFAEAVDVELQSIVTNFNSNINALNSRLLPLEATQTIINAPNFTDPCNIGLTGSDTLFTSVQKLINFSCTRCEAEEVTGPALVVVESATVSAVQSGELDHNVILNVKRSAQTPNALVVNTDGLYVAPLSVPNQIQTLSYNGLNGNLSISGGNTVTIPLPVPQLLQYDCATNMISLTGGGGVQDLSCLIAKATFTESSVTFAPSNTLVITTGAPNGHALGGNVKIAPGANALQETASGLVVQPVSFENALTPTGSVVRWGGTLMQNTLVDGSAYDIGFSPRKFIVGNNITTAFGSTDPILNTRYMQVWAAYNHSAVGSHALQSILEYTIDANISGSSGLYTSSGMAFARYNLNATTSIGLGFGLHSMGSMMRIKNTNPTANITMVPPGAGDGIHAMSVYKGSVIMESGVAANTGVVSHIAVFSSDGFFQEIAGSNYTHTTNAYGLILNPILATGDTSKFTNTFGVVQIGAIDDNSFEADVTATILPPSDERIKSNIRDFTNGLDIINCIDIKRFDIRRGKRTEPDIGIIAQQLKNVLPEAVKQKIYLGYEDFNTIDIMKLLSVAIKAIQELSCKVNSLHITSSHSE